MNSKLRIWKRWSISFLCLLMLLVLLYVFYIYLNSTLLYLFLKKGSFVIGGRALSFLLHMCLGGSGGLFAAAILFAVRALLATEAAPPFGNAVSPGREPELDLRLGQPGVQVEDPEGLSPAERQLRERLNRDGRDNISLDDVQAMAGMKEDIVTRISQLDPNPFWTEQRARIISSYIVTSKGEEYSLATLEKIWRELGDANSQDHYFVKRMLKLRKDYELLGRFY